MTMKVLSTLLLAGALTQSAAGQGTEESKAQVLSMVGELKSTSDQIASFLWTNAETALREHRSAAFLADLLEQKGFQVERGVAGMPTAFVATYGSGRPVIGILAEFDALPGVGNRAEPRRIARDDGVTAGHGCGHNLFAAGSVTAVLALERLIADRGLGGTIKLFGTPAEETVVGKVYMANAGLFAGLDAALDWHPDDKTRVGNSATQAMNSFEVEFFGQAAHSAYDPWNGRSALDAVEMMNYGVNLMREHIRPTARIHYVIPSAGEAPNVVPEYARVWYYVRDLNREEVEKYYQRILKIAEGATLATRTTHKVRLLTGVHEYLFNRPLQEALQANLERVGPPAFTDEEQAFARALQRETGAPEEGFSTAIEPLADSVQPAEGGSTDVAEVSYMTPTAPLNVATAALAVPWHSWATTACHGTSAGRRGALVAAQVLAATGVDILTRPELVQRMRAAFEEATASRPYVSPIPVDQAPPLPDDPR